MRGDITHKHIVRLEPFDDVVCYHHVVSRDGQKYILQTTVEEIELKPFGIAPTCTYRWDIEAAQQIINDLWRVLGQKTVRKFH